MPRPNLVNAETLCMIAKLGSFRAAAERLYTSQPAVSARMRELEQSLGFALFEKRGRRLELTVPARRFVERVEPLLLAVEDAFTDAEAVTNAAGTVRIGMGEISMTWFSRVVPELRRALPRVSYEIELDLAVKLQEHLASGALDIAIVANRLRDDQFICTPLGTTRMSWMVSSRLLTDAQGQPRSMQSLLRTEPLWCVSRPSGFFGPAQDELRAMGANLDNVCSCNRLNSLIEVVEAGGGIAQLPEMMVTEQVKAGTLVPVAPDLEPLTLEFTLATHRNQGQAVVRQVVQALARLGKAATGRPRAARRPLTRPTAPA